ncbi:gasdermin-C [Mus pahari]|uniref:gasdermin-C n=1 Tax=Mus pahari TaxID=10093 RepID=UPI000A30C921|nr:gasdermin-C [Mus pahari]
MPYTFDWLSKEVVKKLQGRDLRPVKSLADATKFRLFYILQETSPWLAFKTEYIPVEFTLLDVLEPNFPVPEPEVSAPIPLKHTVSQKLKANVDVEPIAGGDAGFVKSGGYDIEVQSMSIPNKKLESLQNRKLLDKLPSYMKNCCIEGKNLYVVTEAYEVTKDTVLEGKCSVNILGKGSIKQLFKVQDGDKKAKRTDSIPILKGSVLAYKKQQLVIEDNTCAILPSANAKKKMTFANRPMYLSGHFEILRHHEEIIRIGSRIEYISPIGTIEEPTHLDFQCLQNEVSQKTMLLAELSKDVQEVVFSSFLHMLCEGDSEVLYDLMKMLELNQLEHMDGPGGKILEELQKDRSPSWIDLKDLILNLLQALMVLSNTQLSLLAQSVEMRLLLQQQELVKSILQPNYKYPWHIPFTLQPQLLAPLQGEGLAITYELLEECGLKMELNNPRSTWHLEVKMPLSALYASLSLLQQLSEA